MKVDSKILKRSMKFYRNCDLMPDMYSFAFHLYRKEASNYKFKHYRDFFKALLADYPKYMQKYFEPNLLFADEVLKFAFDEQGNILELDKIIYHKLRLCAANCRVIYYEEKLKTSLKDNLHYNLDL